MNTFEVIPFGQEIGGVSAFEGEYEMGFEQERGRSMRRPPSRSRAAPRRFAPRFQQRPRMIRRAPRAPFRSPASRLRMPGRQFNRHPGHRHRHRGDRGFPGWPVPYPAGPSAWPAPAESGPSEFGRWVQSCLGKALGSEVPVTGIIDGATRAAIRQFQSREGLPADGIIGPPTQTALAAACSRDGAAPTGAPPTPTGDAGPPPEGAAPPADAPPEGQQSEFGFAKRGCGCRKCREEAELHETEAFENEAFEGESEYGEYEGEEEAFEAESFEGEGAFEAESFEFSEWEGEAAGGIGPCPTTSVDCPPPGSRPDVLLDRFKFDNGAIDKARHGPQITDLARRIAASQATRSPIRSLTIAGHTDAVGNDDYNFALARRRAEAVARELCATLERIKPGAGRSLSIQITSCGERQTKAKPEESRRVEIFLPKVPVPPKGCAPFKERVRLHLKILVEPTRFSIARMLSSMRQVYATAGIQVVEASRERLRLPALEVLDIFCPGDPTATCCPFPCATSTLNPEYVDLFTHRRGVGAKDIVVYFVRRTVPGLNGCCAHPVGRPGVVVTANASQWTLAHEVGHVLGLPHVNSSDRLMTGGGTNNITNPPPDLIASEKTTMLASALSVPC